ncbi:MAG: FAD-linked oxidase C-terminal domain-containing protein, partial [Vicinamibacterales bacterium]|nr:FAD-linked oxidase C-terminal domain-containing protein [Vicinamibacterales bacterium]
DCLLETKQELRDSTLTEQIVGHVVDGNVHVLFVVNPDDAREMAEATALNVALVRRALAMGGTCTGEHGVGTGKMDYLVEEHGEAVEVMKSLKRALDPDNLMNPGKMLRL